MVTITVIISLSSSMKNFVGVTITRFYRSDVKDFKLRINKNNTKILKLKKIIE